MFYPLEPLPPLFQWIGYANPITWQVDIFRYATIGIGSAGTLLLEGLAFCVFSAGCFALALRALHRQE